MRAHVRRSSRFSLLIALSLGGALIGLVSHSAFSQSSRSPAARAAAKSEVGRYQMTNSSGGLLVLLDTATGRCWRRQEVPNPGTDEQGWQEISPSWARGK